MAVRPLASALARALQLAPGARYASSAPTVFDKLVRIIVVDTKGNRHVMLGREGQPLTDVLQQNADALGGEENVMCLSPAGVGRLEAHITVPNELLETVPKPEGLEERYLREIAPTVYNNSRLASKMVLTKDMNGVSVALRDTYPWKTL